MAAPVLLWLRRDLRLADQPALAAACAEGPVVPVYVLDDDTPKHRRMGGATRWWLHQSLARLSEALAGKGSQLILRRGNVAEILPGLAREVGAHRVHAMHHHEPWWRNAERQIRRELDLVLHDGNYLHPPATLLTGGGTPYRIFTPFWRALQEQMPPALALPEPERLPAPVQWPASDRLEDWGLLPTNPDWAKSFYERWQPGEQEALDRLEQFAGKVGAYDHARNLPSVEGSSRLSPHLHFGEISPATIWHKLAGRGGAEPFLRELGWRDYAQSLIVQFPDYGRTNGKPQFDGLQWRDPDEAAGDIAAWQQGRTGYPIVDAGMRELWATGWMHNRVRMITASFLIKHLLVDWRIGEQWFWDTLVDADYATNATNWQWVAGSGVDANLFTRIMAPLTQSEKFEAGNYIRRWVPELANLTDPAVHDPHAFGQYPRNYPRKIVDHRWARERALAAWAVLRG